jgi:hypothetical protein
MWILHAFCFLHFSHFLCFGQPPPFSPHHPHAEAMRYLEGRRRITDARELAKELCPNLLKYY